MDLNQKNPNEPWWRPAVMLFSEVSTWIVFPLILALVLGKYLDQRFSTSPWIFLGLTIVSFFVSCAGIYRVVSKFMKNPNGGSGDLQKK